MFSPRSHQLSRSLHLKMGSWAGTISLSLLIISLTTPSLAWVVDLAREGEGTQPRYVTLV